MEFQNDRLDYHPLSNSFNTEMPEFNAAVGPWRCRSNDVDFDAEFLEVHESHHRDGIVVRVSTFHSGRISLGECVVLGRASAVQVRDRLNDLIDRLPNPHNVTAEELPELQGKFTWCLHGPEYLVETPRGNFIWQSPAYDGDNTIRPTDLCYGEWLLGLQIEFGRDKGEHKVGEFAPGAKLVP